MKHGWLNSIKFLVLIIIGIILIIYVYMKNLNEKDIKNIVEKFQLDYDYHDTYFDLSANYYEMTNEEVGPRHSPVLDDVILDIGGAFGEVDSSKIPWDSENRALRPSEALWGIVPPEASAMIFKKVYATQQLSDVSTMAFDDTSNAFHYDDPMFATGTDSQIAGLAMQTSSGIAQLVVPFALSFIKVAQDIEEDFQKLLSNMPSPTKVAADVGSAVKNVGTASFRGIKALLSGSAKSGAVKGGEAAAKNTRKAMAAVFAKKSGKAMGKLMLGAIIIPFSLAWVPPAWFGATLEVIYNFIFTPLLILLTIPGGPLTKVLETLGETSGCCPANSRSLDIALPPEAEFIISMVPIWGDVLDMIYPYMCQTSTGALVPKTKLCLPKYIDYKWLSCYYFNWPDYNCIAETCRVQGKYFDTDSVNKALQVGTIAGDTALAIVGALTGEIGVAVATVGIINNPFSTVNQWTFGPYTDFNSIKNNPDYYRLKNKKLDGFVHVIYNEHYIIPKGNRFYYCDFSDPNMLLKMAQFYYDNGTSKIFRNDDGTVSVQYISKINYVTASSLNSCDIMCEMNNITYDPISGCNYGSVISTGHDRRFYYDTAKGNICPDYWEKIGDSTWVNLDDNYDIAVRNFQHYIHGDNFNNYEFIADILITAYEIKVRSSNAYQTAYTNANSNSSNMFVKDYFDKYTEDNNNYRTKFNQLKPKNATGSNLSTLDSYLSTIVAYKDALLTHQYSLPTINLNAPNPYPQYLLRGCTFLDDTGTDAYEPDVRNDEIDRRKRVDFDVTPYLKRCENLIINMNQCIDISNVHMIVDTYLKDNPNKRIKSIKSIESQGKNACKYIWDEITINPVTKVESDYVEKTNKILFQQDLSSCSFCLPRDPSSNIKLYGTADSQSIQTGTPTDINYFTKPITDTINHIYNINEPLTYKQGFYYEPVLHAPTGELRYMNRCNNADIIPRYSPFDFSLLPPLARPKKPIRVHYPLDPQHTLDNIPGNYCGNEATLKKIISDYNLKDMNTNKILKIIRAYTTSSNICDLEVDMLIKDENKVQRNTLSFNVSQVIFEEAFQSYTYDSLNNTQGLNIQKDTDPLDGKLSTIGVSFSRPYISNVGYSLGPNVAFFNDALITSYTDTTSQLKDNSHRYLTSLVGLQKLGDQNQPTLQKTCDDPEIIQRMVEQYNNDNHPRSRYGVEDNSIVTVVRAATDSANTCHLIFENEKNQYGDYYGANNDSNVLTTRNLYLKEFKVFQQTGTSNFYPVIYPTQTYPDISASDIALSSTNDFPNYKDPLRDNCQVNARGPHMNDAFQQYMDTTNNIITSLHASMSVGYNICDYDIRLDIYLEDTQQYVHDVTGVLRFRYNYPTYSTANSVCGTFGYTNSSSNYSLQVFGYNVSNTSPNISPLFSVMGISDMAPVPLVRNGTVNTTVINF